MGLIGLGSAWTSSSAAGACCLIPEFIPVSGSLDDIVVVALALRYAGRQMPCEVIPEVWPGDPRLIERLLGPAASDPPVVPPSES